MTSTRSLLPLGNQQSIPSIRNPGPILTDKAIWRARDQARTDDLDSFGQVTDGAVVLTLHRSTWDRRPLVTPVPAPPPRAPLVREEWQSWRLPRPSAASRAVSPWPRACRGASWIDRSPPTAWQGW